MDSAKLNDWLQVVGLFGVIASLTFVGLQMKQDREIALSAATQTRTDTTINNISSTAANPFYLAAVDKIAAGQPETLLPSERHVLFLQAQMVLFNFENVHYQYQGGFIPDERWEGTRQALMTLFRQPYGVRATYESNPSAWRKSFQAVVDELLAEIDAEDKK